MTPGRPAGRARRTLAGWLLLAGLAASGPLAFSADEGGAPEPRAAARDKDTPAPGGRAPEPHRRAGDEPLDYRGPGREEAAPQVDEIAIGWFGPGDPGHADFGALWRGAVLGLELENAAGGFRTSAASGSVPFRLRAVWSENPWQAGITELTRLTYDEKVWAVLGGVDGSTTHLAVQSALKSRFLLLSPGSTDPTTDHANVPWLFSLAPSDEAQAPVLADALLRTLGSSSAASEPARPGTFLIAAGTDHDSHAALAEVRRALAARRLHPLALVEFAAAERDSAALARRIRDARPAVVVVLAPAVAAGRLVAALRQAGHTGPVLGGATLATNAFARAAGAAGEGVLAPLLIEPSPEWSSFAAAYEKRWSEPPDHAAAHGYDGVRLLAAAVRRAGTNRARIRDAVRALAPWSGASGDVAWDARGRNTRAVRLGRWREGRLLEAP